MTVNTSDTAKFKAYKIMSDGTEQPITDDDLAKLNITYTYNSSSKDDERFGNQAENNDFSYSNPIITVNNVSRYKDSVYKLNASYDNNKYKTSFNLVFEKTSDSVTYYTAQVIFNNDDKDSSAHNPSNISYFEEDNNRTHEYEFTFVIADDNGTKTVSDIRHNGSSIGTSSDYWTNALDNMQHSFRILNDYNSHSFNNNWTALQTSPSSTDYSTIVDYIKGQTPTGGKINAIEFAAHLT
ncbi:MAG: hypothetical protein IIT39_08175 [Clostridia bacterium]|nr:hypothetical protein [Clostridia bacterium]